MTTIITFLLYLIAHIGAIILLLVFVFLIIFIWERTL